jgi:hypothetical protein
MKHACTVSKISGTNLGLYTYVNADFHRAGLKGRMQLTSEHSMRLIKSKIEQMLCTPSTDCGIKLAAL